MINSFFPPYDNHPDESFSTPPVNLTRIVTVKLQKDWYPCETSFGDRVISVTCHEPNPADASVDQMWTAMTNENETYFLADPNGIISGEYLAIQDNGGTYLPAGQICKVHLPDESQDGHYELLSVGVLCKCEETSSEEEEISSEEEPSGEEESSSEEGSEEEGSSDEGSGEETSSEECGPCFPVTGDPSNWPEDANATFALGIGTTDCGCETFCKIPINDCPSSDVVDGGGP